MSEPIRLATKTRTALGRNAVKHLRKEGHVPSVIYGHKEAPVSISVEERRLQDALKHHVHFLELDLDGTIETALLQDLQYDAFGQHILHADFLRVDIDEPVDVSIGVELRGHPKGASEGGILQRFLNEIRVRCAPRIIPDLVEVDVSGLGVHEQYLLKDVKLPDGVKLVDDPDKALCAVVTQKIEVVAVAAEAPAAPEVIGEKKGEEPTEEA